MEKTPSSSVPTTLDPEVGECVATDPFGRPLVPDPTSDALDPLNWPLGRKYPIIGTVCFAYFMMIYAISAPVPAFPQLQTQFNTSYVKILWTFALANLGSAVGPLLASASADIVGRRTIMIFGTIVSVVGSGVASLHGITYGGYSAARFFQVLGATPAISVGLSIINDLSWEHERGFRVGLWVMSIDLGAYFGPLIGSMVATRGQYWVQYHVTILFGLLLFLEVAFLPETLYPRDTVLSLGPRVNSEDIHIKRTTQLAFINLSKIPGVQHPKPWATLFAFFKMFSRPAIIIPQIAFAFAVYWWIVSVITMVPIAYPQYGLTTQGLLFLGFIVGTIVAEILFSGRTSDYIIGRITTRRNIAREPEMRLWLAYLGITMFAAGLLLWGASVEKSYHIMIGQAAFFLQGAGLQVTNTVVAAYTIDNDPDSCMDIITSYAVLINLSSFANAWYIGDWVIAHGFYLTFGIQAAIAVGVMIPTLALLHVFGPRLRGSSQLVSAQGGI